MTLITRSRITSYNVCYTKLLRVDFGFYLDGGEEHGEILLPERYAPPTLEPGEEIEVFIYKDSEDRIIATTEEPFAEVGEVAFLEATAVTNIGAFLDWGLMKDVLCPFREQTVKMEVGKFYPVYLYVDDESQRIVASAKVHNFLDNVMPVYQEGDKVDIMVIGQTDLGYKVAINDMHSGLLYKNEVFTKLRIGDTKQAYIKKVREDDKIDVTLQLGGYDKTDGLAGDILRKLQANNGYMPISDKSPADDIYAEFGMSKKNFKKARNNFV